MIATIDCCMENFADLWYSFYSWLSAADFSIRNTRIGQLAYWKHWKRPSGWPHNKKQDWINRRTVNSDTIIMWWKEEHEMRY